MTNLEKICAHVTCWENLASIREQIIYGSRDADENGLTGAYQVPLSPQLLNPTSLAPFIAPVIRASNLIRTLHFVYILREVVLTPLPFVLFFNPLQRICPNTLMTDTNLNEELLLEHGKTTSMIHSVFSTEELVPAVGPTTMLGG